ncbi:MAG: SAF domain-containing protein [Ornithinibacter sp.]
MKTLPFTGVTGVSRRAHWRRHVLRRVAAGTLISTALLLVLLELRPLAPPSTTVVIARHRVAAGSVLAPGDLDAVDVPLAQAQPGHVRDPAQVAGRRLGSALATGEALTTTRLAPRSAADGLAVSLTAVHVVAADPDSVSLLHVGQRVVVYGPAGGPPLAQSARLLAIDPAQPPDPLSGRQPPARGVVLALERGDVQKVLTTSDAVPGPPVVHVIGTG